MNDGDVSGLYHTEAGTGGDSSALGVDSTLFYAVKTDGTFAHWNEAFSTVTGYDADELASRSLPDLVTSEDRSRVAETIDRVSDGSDEETVEADLRTSAGEEIPFEFTLWALRGDPELVVGVALDTSIRRELELKNRAMDEVPVGITISDPALEDNPVIYANEGFERITGYPRDEILGRNCRFLQGEETDPERVAEMREAISSRESVTVTLRNYRKDGTLFWNQVTIAPVTDDSGGVTHFVGFQQDVTDREEYQRELERHNERLEEFARIVSHDLRNPLNVAQGRLDLVREEVDSDHLAPIDDALDRMERIIADTLTLARQGQSVSDLEPVSVREVTEQCWSMVDTDRATLTVVDEFELLADADRLQHVLENLFRNAVEHGGDDVAVRVGLIDDRGFYVADDGRGIPPDERDEIFEPGYSSTDEGTGFGLSIVKRIAEAHGWDVGVTESDEGGARFEFTGVDVST